MELLVSGDGELLAYLCDNLDMSRKRIKQYLTHGSIYVNNQQIRQYNYPLVAGMHIFIDTVSKYKKILPFDILYEDQSIIVVNKPSGLLVIATERQRDRTLYHIVREYLVSKDRHAKVFVVHRLDRDTSGIVIFAKNEKIKKQLQDNWNEYVSLREYVAVVHGHLKKKEGSIEQYIKNAKNNFVYVVSKDKGQKAITNYKVIKESTSYSMVSVFLETGRKNQIRVAFQSLGNPIVGDKKYGEKDGAVRLYLHANRLKIYYPILKKEILFEVSYPQEFKRIVNK